MKIRVTNQGTNGKKINLPKAIWETLDLKSGDYLEVTIQKNGKIILEKSKEK